MTRKNVFTLMILISTFVLAGCSNTSQKPPLTESPAKPPQSLSYNAELDNYPYPFPVSHFHFTSQGQKLKMAYMFLRGQSSKPTVLLLHGKNFPGAYWKTTAEYLQSEGYSVLIPDQIGFGKSTKPSYYQYSFPQMVHNTLLLANSLNVQKVIVVGHSMGGMLATRFALMNERRVERLILINPLGLEDYLEFVEYKDPQFFYENEREMTPERVKAYQQKSYYDGKWSDAYQPWVDVQAGWINGPDWKRIAFNNALTYDMIFSQPVANELKELRQPTFLILGTRDRTAPGNNWKRPGVKYKMGQFQTLGDRVVKDLRRGHLIKLEGLGHLPHIEDFARFKAAFARSLK